MIKRVALLVVVVLIIIAGPVLLAGECWRCAIVPAPQVSYCVVHTSSQTQGWTICIDDETGCYVGGSRCYAQWVGLAAPLAAEYAVASVERLDEPQTADSYTVPREPVTSR